MFKTGISTTKILIYEEVSADFPGTDAVTHAQGMKKENVAHQKSKDGKDIKKPRSHH